MDLLPEVEGEVVSKHNRFAKAIAANARLRTLLIVVVVLLIAGIVAVVSLYSSVRTKIEYELRDEFDNKISSLENDIKDTKEKYEEKLANQKDSYEKKLLKQKESYEKELSSAAEKHQKEVDKKDSKIKELEEEIRILEVKDKISFNQIETEIKSVGKLTTIDYHYTYAGTHEESMKFFGLDTGIVKNSFIAQWDGVVAIGVDLSKVKINANESTKTITISMPKAEIFYHDVDEKSFEVLNQQNNIFDPITVEDKIQFDIKYEQKIYEKIEENRMLEDAYKNAQTMINNILKGIPQISEQYTITYKQIK